MNQAEVYNESDILNELFPDGNYSSILNDLVLSFADSHPDQPLDTQMSLSNVEVEGDNLDDWLSSWLLTDPNLEQSSIIDGYTSSMPISVAENNSPTVPEGEQPIEDGSLHQNSDVTTNIIPQQAIGNEEGIMYQLFPALSDLIVGNISVKQQPKANKRSRYQCDGPRFLPDSRHHPMSISLPDLRLIALQSNQMLGIVLTIVTDTPDGTIVHANDITYRIDGAVKIGYGCVFVPLDNVDKQNGEKKFPRLSMIYKKCDEYTFDLTPFDPLSMFGITGKYISSNEKNTGNAARGKDFKKDYNLLSYKIVFHLALKEDNIIYISRTTCETQAVDEKKAAPSSSSNKRSASSSTEILSEEDSTSDSPTSSPSKKFKPSSIIGLPVTHASHTPHIDNDIRC